jgi:hypothetical protein
MAYTVSHRLDTAHGPNYVARDFKGYDDIWAE